MQLIRAAASAFIVRWIHLNLSYTADAAVNRIGCILLSGRARLLHRPSDGWLTLDQTGQAGRVPSRPIHSAGQSYNGAIA